MFWPRVQDLTILPYLLNGSRVGNKGLQCVQVWSMRELYTLLHSTCVVGKMERLLTSAECLSTATPQSIRPTGDVVLKLTSSEPESGETLIGDGLSEGGFSS